MEDTNTDKLAGRAPAVKVGGARVAQTKKNTTNASTKNDETEINQQELPTPVANIGGLGGIQPNMTTATDQIESVEEVSMKSIISSTTHNKPSNAAKLSKHSMDKLPTVQASHKPMQKNINQPSKFSGSSGNKH